MFTVAIAALSVSALANTPGPQQAKPDLAKGEASFGAVCAACHGTDGNSSIPANPKLAQQHPQYLVKQLQEFKSGKRNNAIMLGFATALSDDDMRNIAHWLASNPAKPGFAKDKELVALGERIYRGGICRPPGSGMRWLPQPQRCRHSRQSTRVWLDSMPTIR